MLRSKPLISSECSNISDSHAGFFFVGLLAYVTYFFCYGLGLGEEQQVVWAAGFAIGAGHVEAAEGVCAYHGSGAFAVEV